MVNRRTAFALCGAIGALLAPPAWAAENYPSETVTIVVPYPPGGSADLIGRMLADKLSESLGATVIVDNRGGASGAIGSEYAARSNPDGHTILIGIADTHAINPAVSTNLPYDPVEDFEPISLLATQPFILAVGAATEAQTLEDFIAEARANPGEAFYASNGTGGMQHLAMELFAPMAGIEVSHVPYPGSGPALADVAGGHVESIFISLQAGGGNFAAGTLRPLAISSAERLNEAPDLPTFTELGYPEFQIQQWYGAFVPAGTPADIVELLNEHVSSAMLSEDITAQLGAAGTQTVGGTPEEFRAFLEGEIALWDEVATTNEITVD